MVERSWRRMAVLSRCWVIVISRWRPASPWISENFRCSSAICWRSASMRSSASARSPASLASIRCSSASRFWSASAICTSRSLALAGASASPSGRVSASWLMVACFSFTARLVPVLSLKTAVRIESIRTRACVPSLRPLLTGYSVNAFPAICSRRSWSISIGRLSRSTFTRSFFVARRKSTGLMLIRSVSRLMVSAGLLSRLPSAFFTTVVLAAGVTRLAISVPSSSTSTVSPFSAPVRSRVASCPPRSVALMASSTLVFPVPLGPLIWLNCPASNSSSSMPRMLLIRILAILVMVVSGGG